jgi:two-component system, NarL family, nitrate/nitrite response regulator NarL
MAMVAKGERLIETGAHPDRIRIAIIGGQSLMREALRALVNQQADLYALAAGELEALVHRTDGAPSVVVLDVDGEHVDMIVMLHETRDAWPTAHVIVLVARCHSDRAQEFVLAGASGVLTKDKPADHLANAIRKVHEGEVWLGRAPMAHLVAELAWNAHTANVDPEHECIASLTARERDVVELVTGGLSNKAIANKLGISDNTVRHHLTSVFAKLDVPDRLALAVYAFRHRLVRGQRR